MSNTLYPPYSNVKVLVELLKKHQITHVVISSGTRHTPLVNLLETDAFFHCYSVVDERSAAFFALGLIQTLQQPVAISCTSGTSVCNYLSGIAEARYRNLPLLVLTADRDPRLLNQMVEQMIPQSQLTEVLCKKVELPFVETEEDFYYCQRLVNEAILELNHHGCRPVNINYPIEFKGISSIKDVKTQFISKLGDDAKIPDIVKVTRTTDGSSIAEWEAKAKELSAAKKIMILYGQHNPLSAEDIAILEEFAEKYNAVYITDNLSNLHCKGSVTTYLTSISSKVFEELVPDILITMNGNMMSSIKGRVGGYKKRYHHWMVTGDGHLADPWCSLTDVFECDAIDFFRKILASHEKDVIKNTYCEAWIKAMEGYAVPDVPYSDTYITLELLKQLPKDSLLHLANSTTIRVGSLLPIDPSIHVYCNRGTNGIDGSLSTFVGQSAVSEKLSFLIIGDLSFFYDMNGLWNRYVGNNVRIMLNNNGCGEIFYYTGTIKTQGMFPNLYKHIGAAHNTEAKGWVESRGFRYLSARTKEEYDANLKEFLSAESDKPIFFEIFTDNAKNAELMDSAYSSNDIRIKIAKAGLHALGLQ